MAPEVRLSGPENEPLGIVSLSEALRMAGELDVDLVEIAPTAKPPVCRLMDYGKFKYQEQKKAAEAKAKQTVIDIKEVKFRPGTDDGDYNIKMRLRRFIAEVRKAGRGTAAARSPTRTSAWAAAGIRDELADVSVVRHMPNSRAPDDHGAAPKQVRGRQSSSTLVLVASALPRATAGLQEAKSFRGLTSTNKGAFTCPK